MAPKKLTRKRMESYARELHALGEKYGLVISTQAFGSDCFVVEPGQVGSYVFEQAPDGWWFVYPDPRPYESEGAHG